MEKNREQTAVEFMLDELQKRKLLNIDLDYFPMMKFRVLYDVFSEAYEIEKKQIMKAFQDGAHVGYNQDATSEEQYYNNNYGKQID